ncbi:ABC-2 type transporter [delta proteobacterium NaphS2]|nr:ABC-2 type transporter [delta proteobacterium NaphS2]
MRPGNVFQLDTAAFLANRRGLIIRLGFTMLLGLPFVIIAMPLKIRLSGLSFIIIFVTFFGAAVSSVRRKTEGHYERLKVLPLPLWIIQMDMMLAGALVDFIQTGFLLVLFIAFYGTGITFGAILEISGLFITTLLLFNALGMMLACLMKNNSEVHLFGALGAFILAFISGLMPAPAVIQKWIVIIGRWNPLTAMGRSLMGTAQGQMGGIHDAGVFWGLMTLIFLIIVFIRLFEGRSLNAFS